VPTLRLLDLQIADAEVEFDRTRLREWYLKVNRFDHARVQRRRRRIVLHGRVGHVAVEPARGGNHQVGVVNVAARFLKIHPQLLTPGFGDSWWTNQKVGVALGRRVPVVSVQLGEDPRGFIGASQAIRAQNKDAAERARRLFEAFSGYPHLQPTLLSSLVRQWESVRSFSEGIRVMDLLNGCKAMPEDLLLRVENAYRDNDQLHNSVGVKRKYADFIARMKARTRRT
jgi:hypothetical protein